MKRRMTKDGTVRGSTSGNRRNFLKASALAAGYGVWVATGNREVALAQQEANDKLNVAWVGVGGKGAGDADQVAKVANLVAVCDTDEKIANGKADAHDKDGKKPKVYNDWRKLLDEMGKEIDAVGVSVPDHNHTIIAVHAMKMGKHVYCQKPLTHSVAESRVMRETANEHKVVTQMGNQGTASPGLRTGVEAIRSGMLGTVRAVHVWTNRPIWPQAPTVMEWPKAQPTPENINWDVWLGPAPEHPYNKEYASFNWRGYWDFGTGALGDMGCHTFNLPYMALKLTVPTRVKGVCADLNPVTYPAWATVQYHMPEREQMPPVLVTWYEGHFGYLEKRRNNRSGRDEPYQLKNLPPLALFKGQTPSQSGSLTVGDKATLYSPQDYGASWKVLSNDGEVLLDYDEKKGVVSGKAPDETLPRFPDTRKNKTEAPRDDDNMKLEWANAIKGKGKTMSNFNYATQLVEFMLLGNVAIRVPGQPLDWDSKNMTISNDTNADKYLKTEYRSGWSL
ncbi:MAG TPA: Gfo/Idh/MocA family oxidoreductase [Bryobacteraceae bacterium]|nr:Gfo/Idh/MocA family oxidoreductase [Bryobacteraceae bacterium]